MEMKSFSIAVLVAEDAQHASWRRAGERDVAFQQCSLWRTYVVVDDKRRKLVNPFILFLLLPFLGRQSVKLAACLTKSLCFSVSLQTQLCDVGLFSDELTLFCFSDCHLLSTQPVFQISLSAHLTFFFPVSFKLLLWTSGLKFMAIMLLLAKTPFPKNNLFTS